jgi:hypothetical protein
MPSVGKGAAMSPYRPYVIKSFKHNGSLHRMWLENWLIPPDRLAPEHRDLIVLINYQTRIFESSGKEWSSRIPGISVFFPKRWYNVVALLEDTGTRYYCNIASPPYRTEDTVTYIDYDLDVIVSAEPNRGFVIVDEEEYELHKIRYRYSAVVERKVKRGLKELLERIRRKDAPFQDETMLRYFEEWQSFTVGADRTAPDDPE